MREIKFRAWDGSEMVYAGSLYTTTKQIELTVHFSGNKDSVLMQYTGLKDKNGTPIYEGDILKHTYMDSLLNWLIEFNDGGFTLVNIGIDGYLGVRSKIKQSDFYDREIAGNMFENPELLNA